VTGRSITPSGAALVERAGISHPYTVSRRPRPPSEIGSEHPAFAWCLEHCGPSFIDYSRPVGEHLNPEGRWFNIGSTYRFADQNEAFWFKMAWG
jgi:hypothetical protein